jgi:hypothetical protein
MIREIENHAHRGLAERRHRSGSQPNGMGGQQDGLQDGAHVHIHPGVLAGHAILRDALPIDTDHHDSGRLLKHARRHHPQ